MINVTSPYLPDIEKLYSYIQSIYDSGYLTNNGPLVHRLEERLKAYLGVKHVILTANGTMALDIAYTALHLKGEVITTPFTFVATTNSLVHAGLKPIYADIDPETFNLDPANIEPLITDRTTAIVPVHVFGNACDVESIETIAKKHNLKIIYDAAHAFGVRYGENSILNFGDISILSFHATKMFHTIEGGAIVTNDDTLAKEIRIIKNFGIDCPDTIKTVGINGKMNEFSAAMGLCVLDDIDIIIQRRKKIHDTYKQKLEGFVEFQSQNPKATQNYSYFPILLKNEREMFLVQKSLEEKGIICRRYFHPSLDTIPYMDSAIEMNISRDIAKRILCLPIYPSLDLEDVERIIELTKKVLHARID
ncbi:DegT/DnrJ/EryC1/StrS family aminotransferase [Hydrogenimonas urashimensis]|uniref:DegT/DnrJ/EryC1/StrS family aminotransferase n=1 Tax=Hydrogenimonas urashimensis TaxID=2740515 RepID=UPI0019157BC1|nr:DegT/DnrJ/EryC1/StrS family aminotransferase [Hydrogenimonas urashimensis]